MKNYLITPICILKHCVFGEEFVKKWRNRKFRNDTILHVALFICKSQQLSLCTVSALTDCSASSSFLSKHQKSKQTLFFTSTCFASYKRGIFWKISAHSRNKNSSTTLTALSKNYFSYTKHEVSGRFCKSLVVYKVSTWQHLQLNDINTLKHIDYYF